MRKIILFFTFLVCFFTCLQATSPLPDHLIIPEGSQVFMARSLDGSVIEIQDGAQFSVSSSDIEEVLTWDAQTPIAISPNPYWFSDTDFFITNQKNGTYIGVYYITEPDPKNPLRNTIYHLDPFYGEIVIQDVKGSQLFFEVDPEDIKYIQTWKQGDSIVVGVNDNWYSKMSSNGNFILINFKHLGEVKYVRAVARSL